MIKFPMPNFIHVDGWEIHITDNNLKIPRDCPRLTRKNARNYIKGLRKLWKAASETKHFFEALAEKIHNNYNTQESKYQKLIQLSQTSIVKIGEGSNFAIESYVDGSYTVIL
jgi:hypothetical protein